MAALASALPAMAGAQGTELQAPAHISLVDGTAVLERDGRTDTAPASMPLLAGDRVRTESGRVEILFDDGSTLHLDTRTVVDFQSDEVVRLLEGRIRLNIPGPNRTVSYRIDAPSAWIQVTEPGEYRVALLQSGANPDVELAVLRGAAEIVNESGRTPLRAGERAYARAGAAPSYAYVFNSAAWDAFDRWSEARRDERLGVSTEYLPDEVRPYASTFDSYGYWRQEPTYGYVWYPRVHASWRPYYHGRWHTLRPYGWTWVGSDPWAWPTHHYGRWGFSAGAWFWIPGRTWGPAWVSWAYAPGYVSWCPLGWNNRPVFSFVNVNVFGGRRFNRWHGWTVVPHNRFGRGFVNVHGVNSARIDVRTRSSFVVRDTAPRITGYAVPRSGSPIRVAGTAVPRNRVASSEGPPRETTRATGTAPASPDRGPALRNRRSSAPLTGPGFPAPARAPRASSNTAPPRDPARVRRVPSAPSSAPAGDRQRARPREVSPSSSSPVPSNAVPSRRRTAPESRREPSVGPRSSGAPEVSRSPERYRSVPRRSGQGSSSPEPSRSDRTIRRPSADSAPPSSAPRALPRGRESSGPPSGGYNRRAPSSARPSAAPPPERRSAPAARPSGGGENRSSARAPGPSRSAPSGARSRGNRSSSGGAVRRRPGG